MARPKKPEETAPHDLWLYKDGEARLFTEGEAIPAGWSDTPGEAE